MKRYIVAAVALALLLTTGGGRTFASEKTQSLAPNASSAILIERDTGTVLFDKNSHKKLPPASMTKIMTMILIMEALDTGNIKLTDPVRVSEYAASMGGSQIFLEPGEEMSVHDMMKGIAIGSANDASVAMAEKIGGSEASFVDMMNKKAKQLGLKDTFFKNPTGLPAAGHYSSAHDMAIMGKELLKHEEITKYTGLYEEYLRQNTPNKFWLVNTNRLVKFYPGTDGLKTGFTQEAKYCLTATAKKHDMRVIAVVMGAPNPKQRNQQVTQMFDYAFSQYSTKKLYDRHQIVKQVKIQKGNKQQLAVVTSESISLLSKRGEKENNVKPLIQVNPDLKMPIKKGQQVGTLSIMKGGKTVTKSPLLASENVKNASWWSLFKRTLGHMAKSS
ncbi:D-alanyl-D-alanine carboxypeptidase family protein [Fictibacillus enclensis]|uniref:D-alanyl-D-alanine carboxypeptidase family protein n=1 Tax=Fictibacillus enclensis TaxID=1017270 RepID=UPI0025A02DE9|nr:D-alanyl-D-alanine carboxypeptidase family protein [Fictibacillus enclensis]MDM5338826.1 D-alanyl-D-alanine carboxypeptidase family protein [Fictibacillus enclensis]